VEGAYLSQVGVWDISVYVRRRGMDDALVKWSLDVPAPKSEAADGSPWQTPVRTIAPVWLIVVGLGALGAVPIFWRKPIEETWPQRYADFRRAGVLLLISASVVCAAWLLGFNAETGRGPGDDNPIPASAASVEHGQALYEENCLPCHGKSGLGDGPVALTLNPRPANLQVHMVPGVHTDRQIFEWITDGFPNSVMPAFGGALTEEERWHLLNYIRTLTPP
jgi:mono/diheme cytochrome c family protein